MCVYFFVFKQKTAYEMRISDWSSDVCSSDLRILSDADAALAERRKLVKITGDATRKEFDAQQAGFPSTGRVREFGEKAAEEGSKIEEESSAGLGGGAAVTTANLRAFPAGQGPGAAP